MSDIKKPLATLELASAAVSLVKTAAVVFVMMMLEWARLKERKAAVSAGAAANDLAVEKIKTETATDARQPSTVVDDFLHARGLNGGEPEHPGKSS